MIADERRSSDERRATIRDRSGHELDIWGDGRATNSTPIPEEYLTAEDAEDTEKKYGYENR